mgnify:FL=1
MRGRDDIEAASTISTSLVQNATLCKNRPGCEPTSSAPLISISVNPIQRSLASDGVNHATANHAIPNMWTAAIDV